MTRLVAAVAACLWTAPAVLSGALLPEAALADAPLAAEPGPTPPGSAARRADMPASPPAFQTAPGTAAPDDAAVLLAAPGAGATLRLSGADVALYYLPAGPGGMLVFATLLPRAAPGRAHRLVLALRDGESIGFALPGTGHGRMRLEARGALLRASSAEPDDLTLR